MVRFFIGSCIVNRTLHGRLEVRNFSSRVEKYFTRSPSSLEKYFSTARIEISHLRTAMYYPLYIS